MGCQCGRHTRSGNKHPIGTAGMTAWNKGKKGVSAETSQRLTEGQLRRNAEGRGSIGFTSQRHTDATKAKQSAALKGRQHQPWTEEHLANLKSAKAASSWRSPRGEQHWSYRGGSTRSAALLSGPCFQEWRQQVFERNNWTCQECGVRGGVELNADHIIPKWGDLRLVYVVSNGRTLCRLCHTQTDTFGGKAPRRPKEFQLPLPMVLRDD